jgi:hypothetical protein
VACLLIAFFTLILSLAACYVLVASLPDSMFPRWMPRFHYTGTIIQPSWAFPAHQIAVDSS